MKKQIWIVAVLAALTLTGCHRDMWQQARVEPQSESRFFPDKLGSRLEPQGVVAYGEPKTDTAFHTGYDSAGRLVKEFPIEVTSELIDRGRERFTIFCAPCHGQLGDGNGMIAARGYTVSRPIASYHSERLRNMPVGHFYDVQTNGYGAMFPFAARIKERDRWAIAAYIRVLQQSQNVKESDLTPEQRSALEAALTAPKDAAHGGGHSEEKK